MLSYLRIYIFEVPSAVINTIFRYLKRPNKDFLSQRPRSNQRPFPFYLSYAVHPFFPLRPKDGCFISSNYWTVEVTNILPYERYSNGRSFLRKRIPLTIESEFYMAPKFKMKVVAGALSRMNHLYLRTTRGTSSSRWWDVLKKNFDTSICLIFNNKININQRLSLTCC